MQAKQRGREFDHSPLFNVDVRKKVDHSPPSTPEVKNGWSYTSFPLTRPFMAWTGTSPLPLFSCFRHDSYFYFIILVLWHSTTWYTTKVSAEYVASIFKAPVKMETACSYLMITGNQNTRCHNPENCNLKVQKVSDMQKRPIFRLTDWREAGRKPCRVKTENLNHHGVD